MRIKPDFQRWKRFTWVNHEHEVFALRARRRRKPEQPVVKFQPVVKLDNSPSAGFTSLFP